MKINRNQAFNWMIFLLGLLLITVTLYVIMTLPTHNGAEINIMPFKMSTTDFTIEQWVELAQKPSEITCNVSSYHNPKEFKRIYYNAYAEYMGNQS